MLILWTLACNAEWEPDAGFRGGTANLPPEVGIGYPYDGFTFDSGAVVEVRGFAHDPDDDPHLLDIVVSSDVDGELARPVLATDGAFGIETTLTSGSHVLSVTVADPSGDEATASVSVTVDANQPPSTPSVAIDPTEPGENDDLEAVLTEQSEDPEGFAVVYTYSWTVDGEDAGEDGARIDAELTTLGEVWEVTVVASDGQDEAEPATASVTIGASPPSVSVAIAPEEPTVDSELSCAWTATDPYGGKVDSSAAWSVGGSELGDASEPLTGAFARGDEVSCTVTATSDAGTTVESAVVTIENTPPLIAEVLVSPTSADETTELSCSASASDADGDDLSWTLTWFVDGADVGDGTLTGERFDEGQSVTCEVTADDGYDTTTASSASLLVGNAAPSAPVAALDASSVVAGATLTCSVAADAVDPDPADTLTYSWSWTVDGVDSGETTGSFDTSGLSAGQAVGCVITAADEAVSVPSAAVVATIVDTLGGAYDAADADLWIFGSDGGALGQGIDVVPDMDGDGLPELAVSAPGADGNSGEVFLFPASALSAGASLDESDAAWSFTGAANNDYLGQGRSIVAVDDLDGDGLGELAVGIYGGDSGASNGGEVAVLLSGDAGAWTSGEPLVDHAGVLVTGDGSGDGLGLGLHTGDLDGDGLPELVAGAPREDSGANNAGLVVVFDGSGLTSGSSLDVADADAAIAGAAADDALGYVGVQVVGDLDGDGIVELFVGAYTADDAASDAGTAWLVAGDAVGDGTVSDLAWASITGASADDQLGYAAVDLGDLDGDGQDELAVSALEGDADGTDAGATYLFYGSSLSGTLSASSADLALGGDSDGDRAGRALASGDVDGDGLWDLLAGGPLAETGSDRSTGQAWLFAGADLTSTADGGFDDAPTASFEGDDGSDTLGTGLAVGDLDLDGFDDLVLGATGDDDGSTGGGSTSIFFGP